MADPNLSPLWWDSIPEKPTAEYEALTQLLYDGTPLEIAENFREQGNEAVQRGKVSFIVFHLCYNYNLCDLYQKYYADAVVFYTKAIEQNVPDLEKASIYYSNRAAVQLQLGNLITTTIIQRFAN